MDTTNEKNVVITLEQLAEVVRYIERLAGEKVFDLDIDGTTIKGISAEATVEETPGVPQVSVSRSIVAGILNLLFHFSGIKGESGVYVGAGEIPENYNVQIDPEGDDTIISDGVTFTPALSEEGILSWSNNGNLPNPDPIDLTGPTGKSAYQIAVDKGFKGTEEQWIESLAGAIVDISGVTASVDAYTGVPEVSVEVGGSSTSKTLHFIFKNLRGPTGTPGKAGDKGEIGPTPNIQIGTVTTLPANSKATATIEGTPENPILNLSIPMGPRGYMPTKGIDYFTDEDIEELLSDIAVKVLGGHRFNASNTVPPEGSPEADMITFVFPEI